MAFLVQKGIRENIPNDAKGKVQSFLLEDEGEEESVVQSQLDLRNPRKRIKPGDFWWTLSFWETATVKQQESSVSYSILNPTKFAKISTIGLDKFTHSLT